MLGDFLGNTHYILPIVTSGALLLTALLSASYKNVAGFIRALGFIALSAWAAASYWPIINTVTGSTLALIGSLLVGVSFVAEHIMARKKRPKPDENKVGQKVAAVLNGKTLPPERVNNQPIKAFAPRPQVDTKSDDGEKNIQRSMRLKASLRPEPLVKLPAERRKKARSAVNVLVGIIILGLVGWGSYTLARKILVSKTDFPSIRTQVEELMQSPAPSPSATATPTDLNQANGDEAEELSNATPTPSAPAEEKNMVTIKETETGYLNVREGASTATKVIKQVNPGEKYELLEETESGTWIKIQLDENTAGWVNSKYIEKEGSV